MSTSTSDGIEILSGIKGEENSASTYAISILREIKCHGSGRGVKGKRTDTHTSIQEVSRDCVGVGGSMLRDQFVTICDSEHAGDWFGTTGIISRQRWNR